MQPTETPAATAAEIHPGIDDEAIRTWLADRVDVKGRLRFRQVTGGHSNLTYIVSDEADARWVLRRPPLGRVLATAHDMGREQRIISALGPTDVPVPNVVGYYADDDVNGAPFYVMDFVDGIVVRDHQIAENLTIEQRATASRSIADVLASLHAVDIDAVGLGDLAKRSGYIERQLSRWFGQYRASAEQSGVELPAVAEIHDALVGGIPPTEEVCLVHGDYRLDNVMLGADGSIVAVLDWELCTLGDPMADVGLLDVYWADPGATAALPQTGPTSLDGFWRSRQLIDHYAEVSGRNVSTIDFYVAFGYWKLTCIIAGVYARYAGGAMGDADQRQVDTFRDMLDELTRLSTEACENYRRRV